MGLQGRYTTPSWVSLWGNHLTTHSSPPPLEGPALDVMPLPSAVYPGVVLGVGSADI